MKFLTLPVLSLILLFLAACGGKKEAKDQKPKGGPPAPVVDVLVAQPQALQSATEVAGTVVPFETVQLRPEASGRIVYLNVPEGARVKAGTVLARVNSADLEADLRRARTQQAIAKQTEKRYKELLAVEGLNQADYDQIVSEVSSRQAEIGVLEVQLSKTVVRAPFDGVVGLRQVSLGAYVGPETIIATLQQIDKLKVDFTVPEDKAAQVKIGAQVRLRLDTDTTRHLATVIAIEPQALATTRSLTVRAVLAKPLGAVPGSFVKVYLGEGGEARQSLMVPANAIIPEDVNKTLVVVQQGKAHYQNVKTGIRQAGLVEITDGLKRGDSVVVSGVLFTRPDAPVKVRKVVKSV